MSEIDDIGAQLNLGNITRVDFVQQCVRIVCREVECSRAGLWMFVDQEPRGRSLRCVGMYDREQERMVKAAVQWEDQSGVYFDELERYGSVLANDVRIHPSTSRFYESYFRERDIRSLMAAAFSLNGKLFGAFTCTQIGQQVDWSARQLSILTRIGARATLVLANTSPGQLNSLLEPQ